MLRGLMIAAACLLAAPLIAGEQEKPDPKAELARIEKENRERLAAINAEIARDGKQAPGESDWAGVYVASIRAKIGDFPGIDYLGEDMQTELRIAPQAGFRFEEVGACFPHYRHHGDLTMNGRVLRLNYAEGLDGYDLQFSPFELIVVPWGERRYLVPEDGLIGFCNHVNDGREPRMDSSRGAHYFLRQGDEAKPAPGLPEVPPTFRAWLLYHEVKTAVTGVETNKLEWDCFGYPCWITRITIDQGLASGLKVGMTLYREQANRRDWIYVTREYSDHSDAVVLRRTGGTGKSNPQIGWRLTTRFPTTVDITLPTALESAAKAARKEPTSDPKPSYNKSAPAQRSRCFRLRRW